MKKLKTAPTKPVGAAPDLVVRDERWDPGAELHDEIAGIRKVFVA